MHIDDSSRKKLQTAERNNCREYHIQVTNAAVEWCFLKWKLNYLSVLQTKTGNATEKWKINEQYLRNICKSWNSILKKIYKIITLVRYPVISDVVFASAVQVQLCLCSPNSPPYLPCRCSSAENHVIMNSILLVNPICINSCIFWTFCQQSLRSETYLTLFCPDCKITLSVCISK